jgi:hypothetical protein
MTAYVDVARVLTALPLSTRPDIASDEAEDVSKVARIVMLAEATAEMIDAELKADFHRRPADPEGAAVELLVDGRGSRTLHVHRGIIELDGIDVRYSMSGDWDELEAEDYELVSMFEAEDSTRPYDHIQLSRRLPTFPRGTRLRGHFGWAAAPARLVEMNVAWIRQLWAAGDSYSGAAQVPDGFIQTPRLVLPDPVRMFLTVEKDRYRECYT